MNRKISIVGLGYVGLPIAAAFGRFSRVVGFDINLERIEELKKGHDRTNELTSEELKGTDVLYTANPEDLAGADFHIVTVPTPVDEAKRPDLTPLRKASETLGKVLKKGDIVVYESTVYPGATEDVCVPILEKFSGLTCGPDFKVGYSPERINPGDKEHTLAKITKVVSGMDDESLEIIAQVYESVVTAGIYRASCIKVAEAAKVIENTQRDINIAFVNELALIFDRIGIDTIEVLQAAGTKWNFLNFRPGLVGGHCIGVDPFYLTHKAGELGYHPQVILSGRRINDSIGGYVAQQAIKEIVKAGLNPKEKRITVLGITFKENCPDLRNSGVGEIIKELKAYGIEPQVHDPLALPEEAKHEYGVDLMKWEDLKPAAAVIVAVGHEKYASMTPKDFDALMNGGGRIILDIKSIYDREALKAAGFTVWRL